MKARRSQVMLVVAAAALGALVGLSSFTFWYARGPAYASDDPAACANCHAMQDNYASWAVSSHRSVTCNGCHVPHDVAGKYLAKAEHGARHSYAFTFESVQVIQITPADRKILQANCISCHEASLSFIVQDPTGADLNCTRCHRGVGHVM